MSKKMKENIFLKFMALKKKNKNNNNIFMVKI